MTLRAKGTERLLDVLDLVAAQDAPMTRNAIAARLGAPRSTVYSIVDMLLARGFVDQVEPEGLIVPGRISGLLGQAYDRSAPLARLARNVVAELAQASGEVAELDVLQDWQQLILISRSGKGHGYRLAVEGSRFPLPATASARFLLDRFTLDEIERAVPPADFITPTGVEVTPDKLYGEIAQARAQGYWITRALVDPYVACVTAPVRAGDDRCIGALCLVVALPEIDRREAECVAMTMAAAERLSNVCKVLKNPSF